MLFVTFLGFSVSWRAKAGTASALAQKRKIPIAVIAQTFVPCSILIAYSPIGSSKKRRCSVESSNLNDAPHGIDFAPEAELDAENRTKDAPLGYRDWTYEQCPVHFARGNGPRSQKAFFQKSSGNFFLSATPQTLFPRSGAGMSFRLTRAAN
ncbi:MAG: hypothetical protein ACK557_05050 [Planctomycetota bacterium]